MTGRVAAIHEMTLQPLELKECSPSFGGKVLYIWTNPPNGLIEVLTAEIIQIGMTGKPPALQAGKNGPGALASLWLYRPDGSTSQDELREIETMSAADPLIFIWLFSTTLALIVRHGQHSPESKNQIRFIAQIIGSWLTKPEPREIEYL